MNILITSAGRRVSLVKSFQHEIKKLNLNSKVYATDANSTLSAACHVADNYFNISKLEEPSYVFNLLSLCKNHAVKLIIPTIDTELFLLAENKDVFTDKGINVLISDSELIIKCRNKRKTHKLFSNFGIPVAKEYSKNNLVFPLFIKPYDGSGSIDIFKIDSENQLSKYHYSNKKLMFLEYLDPKEHTEYTVDLYYDKESNLKCIVPRQRIEVRGGEVNKGITRKNFLVEYLKSRMQKFKGAHGCLTTQFFVNNINEDVIGIEINPRFGGGYPLSYLSGANYSKWVLQEYLLNQKIDYFDDWKDNLLMLRYDAEILVHDFRGK